jgi:hypothetical protein
MSLFTHFDSFIPMCFSTPRLPILFILYSPTFYFTRRATHVFGKTHSFQSIVQQLGQSLVFVVILLEHEGSGPILLRFFATLALPEKVSVWCTGVYHQKKRSTGLHQHRI